ncbi:uncharacterized protein LOC142344558 [Convolutriloba macropyga]|uniref:uncharacterized protein LOC142344558 n=1 Tax=Convolutriloba macropyga TaxID=536237 RepID=UPI003F51B9A2
MSLEKDKFVFELCFEKTFILLKQYEGTAEQTECRDFVPPTDCSAIKMDQVRISVDKYMPDKNNGPGNLQCTVKDVSQTRASVFAKKHNQVFLVIKVVNREQCPTPTCSKCSLTTTSVKHGSTVTETTKVGVGLNDLCMGEVYQLQFTRFLAGQQSDNIPTSYFFCAPSDKSVTTEDSNKEKLALVKDLYMPGELLSAELTRTCKSRYDVMKKKDPKTFPPDAALLNIPDTNFVMKIQSKYRLILPEMNLTVNASIPPKYNTYTMDVKQMFSEGGNWEPNLRFTVNKIRLLIIRTIGGQNEQWSVIISVSSQNLKAQLN